MDGGGAGRLWRRFFCRATRRDGDAWYLSEPLRQIFRFFRDFPVVFMCLNMNMLEENTGQMPGKAWRLHRWTAGGRELVLEAPL